MEKVGFAPDYGPSADLCSTPILCQERSSVDAAANAYIEPVADIQASCSMFRHRKLIIGFGNTGREVKVS